MLLTCYHPGWDMNVSIPLLVVKIFPSKPQKLTLLCCSCSAGQYAIYCVHILQMFFSVSHSRIDHFLLMKWCHSQRERMTRLAGNLWQFVCACVCLREMTCNGPLLHKKSSSPAVCLWELHRHWRKYRTEKWGDWDWDWLAEKGEDAVVRNPSWTKSLQRVNVCVNTGPSTWR